jgi:GMP synthase-like glutamine amidotransferase
MRVLILQHIACEPPGVYEDVLDERGVEIVRVELDAGQTPPDWRSVNAIIAMGGPMSVNDDIDWLNREKALIADAVRAGTPFFGACLGAQLLASSLGARVYVGPTPEVGMLPVTLTGDAFDDPVFAGLPREFMTLQWHSDTFDLPAGAVRLAGSSEYPNQAFRWGTGAYAVQFHIEVTSRMACEWAEVPAYKRSLEQTLGPGSFPALLREFDDHVEAMSATARRLFARWLDAAAVAPARSAH